jgi:hypothetical protein
VPDPGHIDVGDLLADEGRELVSARLRAQTYHRTKDIRTAGNEVEETVRAILSRHLPAAYAIGHGHVADASLRVSPQLDVIIHDAISTALIAVGADGTGYYPWESVLAVGEVKTTYRRSERPVEAFSDKVQALRSLDRERPPGNSGLLRLGYGAGITLPVKWPYFNPLFTFLICLESDEFDAGEFSRVAATLPREARPSLIALLDRGIVAHVTRPAPGTIDFDWWPEFPADTPAANPPVWEAVGFPPDRSHASALGTLYLGLITHLTWAAVRSPDMTRYLPPIRSWPLWRHTDDAS